MTTVRRALAFSIVERYLLIVLALASNIILARLLTPEQIGIYSVSLAVIGIAQVMRDFGIGNFLIQERNLTDDHIRTAFGLSLLIGAALFLGVYFIAPWAASFYGEARMVSTLRITALNFLVLPFCSISLALLRRDMQFQRLMIVNFVATVIGFIATLSLAFAGFGPDSMAVGAVLTNACTGFGAWWLRRQHGILMPSLKLWRALLNFGAQSSAANIVTTITMDINDLVLGKALGFAPVAILSRAQGLMNMFHRDVMGAVRNVAYPAFAQAHREQQALEPLYVRSVSIVCLVGWPFYGFLALFALEVLRLMFGPQWDAAAPLVPWFCLSGALACLGNLTNPLMMAAGRIDMVTRGELIFQPLRAGLMVATALSTRSLLACAMAFALSSAIYIPFIYALKQRCLPNDHRALLSGVWISTKVALLALAPAALVAVQSGLQRSAPIGLPTLLTAAALTIAGWLAGIFLFKHPIADDPAFRRATRWWPRPS
jgi:O-antigen/teichoic acid export membrane protein